MIRFFTTAAEKKLLETTLAIVKRMDNNGNVFTIEKNLTLSKARELVKLFEDRGHKQTYWVEEQAPTQPFELKSR
ncbi:MAG: hypothetical protein WC627_05470 [Legionella sp.]|jgi:hypothetical protein